MGEKMNTATEVNLSKSVGVTIDSKKLELKDFISEIEKALLSKEQSTLYCMLALNNVLRQPDLEDIIDAETKAVLKDLWLKIKGSGLNLSDPPILFS